MTASALLDRCREAGIALRVVDGGLEYDAPVASGVDELVDQLAAHKAEIIARLSPPHPPTLTDPRPDLANDSRWWCWLLKLAVAEYVDESGSVLGVLHGVRCCGAILARQPNSSFRLEPGRGYLGKWHEDREHWLLPHRETVVALLARVGEMARESTA